MAWPAGAGWAEGRALTSPAPAYAVPDAEDDLARETAFHDQARAAVVAALSSDAAAGISWCRPTDYYAEMVKGDAHMARVKARLDWEAASMDAAEQR